MGRDFVIDPDDDDRQPRRPFRRPDPPRYQLRPSRSSGSSWWTTASREHFTEQARKIVCGESEEITKAAVSAAAPEKAK